MFYLYINRILCCNVFLLRSSDRLRKKVFIYYFRIGCLSELAFISCVHVCVQVEFEWLRQYWFQGQRYARFCSWWTRPMEQLEKDWRLMETMVRPLRHTLVLTVCLLRTQKFTELSVTLLY